ncbi:MAG: MotA/TolQ/ExbB proton channel family protein [Candidatus Omnitrophica bacterium]|nr:MotA/TolQ/ExbB proton channel family protein [Candidatus Omnitrophota bacterium]
MMAPILLCSVLALAMVIEKFRYFTFINIDAEALKSNIFTAIRDNNIKAALGACDAHDVPLARVLKAGLLQYGKSREEIIRAMEEAGGLEVPELERFLLPLFIIGNVVPFLGLLGTLLGLGSSFYTIHTRAVALNPAVFSDLSFGVWAAFITTVAAFLIAVPVFIIYQYCISRVEYYILQIEAAGPDLADFLTHTA